MNKLFVAIASLSSCVAIFLATDPGRRAFQEVDAGGHLLRLRQCGQGTPTVVFEAGANGPLESWTRVQSQVSKLTSSVAYDRAWNGRSGPGHTPQDARQIARDLHTVLGHAHIAPPYILVGHSLGGPFIRVFTDLYPDEIAGLVLVDPTPDQTPGDKDRAAYANSSEEEIKSLVATFAEARESRVPPAVPVVLITAIGPHSLPNWLTQEQKESFGRAIHDGGEKKLKLHNAWLETVPDAQHIITENSGHVVPLDEPELIVHAIQQMVDDARSRPPAVKKISATPNRL